MTESAVIPAEERDRNAELAAQVVVKGDLSKLTEQEKMAYYTALCRSLGLNPLTRPFEFVTLNGKLTLYAKRDAADQIRRNAGVTVERIEKELVGDIYVVTAYGRTPDGREDASTGAVAVRGLAGEALANAYMKAETKAKRRLALSLVGLGFPTEEEVEDIPPAEEPAPRKTLAERIAEKAAAIAAVEAVETNSVTAPPFEGEVRSEGDQPITGEFTAEEVAEALATPAVETCAWKLGRGQGKPALTCEFPAGHDDEHSWRDIAVREGGRVIRPEAAA